MRDRYMAYPLSVSPIFRLEDNGRSASPAQQQRAYLYRMNTSPGLLAGDSLEMSIRLDAGSSLYLADQAATKVHTMPVAGIDKATSASVHYHIEVCFRADSPNKMSGSGKNSNVAASPTSM
ncbi:MAG: urease accessory protein UreD [Cyanobacteria bacterium J06614_10]